MAKEQTGKREEKLKQEVVISPCMQQIGSMIKASVPIIWVNTHEEDRFVDELYKQVVAKYERELWTWSAWQGLRQGVSHKDCRQANGENEKTNHLPKALDRIVAIQRPNKKRGHVFVMKDMHIALAQPVPRQIRDMYKHLIAEKKTMIIVAPYLAYGAGGQKMGIEPTLDKLIKVVEYELPDKATLRNQVISIVECVKRSYKKEGKDTGNLTYTDDEINSFVSAIQGLTVHEASDALYTCIIDQKRLDERALLKEKQQIIKRSEILEFIEQHPGMSEVGGLDDAKKYFAMFKDQFTPEAEEFGVEPLRGILFVGVPGCLTGDTILQVHHKQKTGGTKPMRLDAFYYRFNKKTKEGIEKGILSKHVKQLDMSIPFKLHSYSEEEKYFRLNEVEKVVYSGVKEVFLLTTDHGAEIKATADHKFLTPSGFVPFKDLHVGDEILSKEGVLLEDHSRGRNSNLPLRMINNVGNHPYARARTVKGLTYTSHPLHRLVVEAHMNNMKLEEFLFALEGDCSNLEFLPEDMEVHHKDGNRSNNTISNLEVLSKEKHARLHMEQGGNINKYQYGGRKQKVQNIERIGPQHTYDICMKDPLNNFLANGLVVHNSGKSLLSKAIAAEWKLPILRLDVGKVMSSLVGSSEEKMRQVITQAEAVAPTLLWIDEIEKSLSGTKSSNHSVSGYETIWVKVDGDIQYTTLRSLHRLWQSYQDEVEALALNPETFKIEWKKVLRSIEHESDGQLVKVKTSSGREVIATQDHSFVSLNRDGELEKLRAKDLLGRLIPFVKNVSIEPKYSEIDFTSYNTKRTFHKMGVVKLDRDFGRLIGLWLAEGSLNGDAVQIACTEQSIINFILEMVAKIWPKKSVSHSYGSIQISSRPFSDWIRQNFVLGALEKEIPDFLLETPREFRLGIIEGALSGDGSALYTNSNSMDLNLFSSSIDLLKGYLMILNSLGVRATITMPILYPSAAASQYNNQPNGSINICNMDYHLFTLISDNKNNNIKAYEPGKIQTHRPTDRIPLPLNTIKALRLNKQDKKQEILRTKAYRGRLSAEKVKEYLVNVPDSPAKERMLNLTNGDVRWDIVQSIEVMEPEETVYDLEIEGSHTFTLASGTVVHNSDGGTLARVFGTLLTAMEERLKNVITIATANDINALPPELIRRFNEVFFVDLPVDSERKEIFKIHLLKRGRDPDKLKLDWDKLLDASVDYTGSEIEKAIKEGIVSAFRDGMRTLKTEDLLQALKGTKPISKVMAEKIKNIRDWAKGRARYASSLAAAAAQPGRQKIRGKKGKEIDLSAMELDEVKLDKEEVPEKQQEVENRITDILEEE